MVCDDVNIKKDVHIFFWDGSEESARMISKKKDDFVKFRWLEAEEEGEDTFFELRIRVDDLTGEIPCSSPTLLTTTRSRTHKTCACTSGYCDTFWAAEIPTFKQAESTAMLFDQMPAFRRFNEQPVHRCFARRPTPRPRLRMTSWDSVA